MVPSLRRFLPILPALLLIALPFVGLIGFALLGETSSASQPVEIHDPLVLSLWVALSATLLSVLAGLPLARAIAGRGPRLRALLRSLVALPMVMPPVVAGVALLVTFGRMSPLGSALEWMGIGLPFTKGAMVVAAAFVSLPFFVLSCEAALSDVDRDLLDAGRTLGASESRLFWRVRLPLSLTGVVVGAVLAFARALGEFGATLAFAGSAPGRRTLTLEVYHQLLDRGDIQGAVVVSLWLLLVGLFLLLLTLGVGRKRA